MAKAVFIATLLFLSAWTTDAQQETAVLLLRVTGLDTINGQISVGLFNNRDAFPNKGKFYRGGKYPVRKDTVDIVFIDLPPGNYAAALYHDRNGNGKLDKNMLRIPTENFGFTRNPKVKLTAPDFEDAMISVSGADTAVIILQKPF